LEAGIHGIKKNTAFAILFCAFICPLFAFVISRMFLTPIRKITDGFKAIEEGTIDMALRLPETSRDEIGELARGFNAFLESLAEKKAAEKALTESEIKYRRIFETLEDVYYQADLNGIITVISPSSYRLSGWQPEELIGKPVTYVYTNPADREKLTVLLSKERFVKDFEVSLKKKDGSTLFLRRTSERSSRSSITCSRTRSSLRPMAARSRFLPGAPRRRT
jgi:PAS domain S-box-containing protein